EVRVVFGPGLPHLPEDLQPSLSQTAQGAGMTLAFVPVGLIVLLSPGHLAPAEIDPQMDGGAQMFVALPTQEDLEDLTGLEANGSGSGQALQTLRIFKDAPIATQLAQQPRRQFGTGSGQRAEEVLVWMACEEIFDGLPIFAQLFLYRFEGGHQR